MEIKNISIDLVKPYWRNPRKIEHAVAGVVASIQRYGYQVPIVIDRENVIVSGHVRYRALRQLDYKQIKVVVVDLSEKEARAFRVADNKSAELAQWDLPRLQEELRAITGEDIKTFFSTEEWRTLIPPIAAPIIASPTNTGLAPMTSPADLVPKQEIMCPHCGEMNILTR